MTTKPHPDEALGMLYAGGTYVLWGFVPLYWALLEGTSPFEITLHRIFWGAAVALAITLLRGHWKNIAAVFRERRLLARLAVSSVLIGLNWTIFIYCVATHQLVESSLGYYLTPLVSIGLGVALLGEKVSRLRIAAIALAVVAVGVQAYALGHVPWVAPALALSFGVYGYVRKLTPVDSLDGLTVETLLLLPIAAAVLGWLAVEGTGAFTPSNVPRDLLLAGGGPITLVPLVLYAAGVKRIRMTTLGFLQYLSPTITLIVAMTLMGEPFTRVDAVTFAIVWMAVMLAAADGQLSRVRPGIRSPAPATRPGDSSP